MESTHAVPFAYSEEAFTQSADDAANEIPSGRALERQRDAEFKADTTCRHGKAITERCERCVTELRLERTSMIVHLLGLDAPIECERVEDTPDGIQPVFTLAQAHAFLAAWNAEADDVRPGHTTRNEHGALVFWFETYNTMRPFCARMDWSGRYRIGDNAPDGERWQWTKGEAK